jgi:hypothetical protein
MSENQKSLQQHHILGCLATWREEDRIAKLVDNVLTGFRQQGLGHGMDDSRGKTKRCTLISSNVFVRWQMKTLQ